MAASALSRAAAAAPVITVVGTSGAGKTTLIEKLIPALQRRGWKVACIKHTHHTIPAAWPEGKDSERFVAAGAPVVALCGPGGTFVNFKAELLPEFLAYQWGKALDLVIAEGYQSSSFPKIEVVRAAHDPRLRTFPHELLALVTDLPELAPPPVPAFDFDALTPLSEHIERVVLCNPHRPD